MHPYPYDTDVVTARHHDLRQEAEARRLARRTRPRRPRLRRLGSRLRTS